MRFSYECDSIDGLVLIDKEYLDELVIDYKNKH